MTKAGPQIDQTAAEAVAAMLGKDRLLTFLDIIRLRLERLAVLIGKLPDSKNEFLFIVHQTRGSAKSLGLVSFSLALDTLEAVSAKEKANTAELADAFRVVQLSFTATQNSLLAAYGE